MIDWLTENDVKVLDWPSRSPDLNSIENMWGLLVKKLQEKQQIFENREQLLVSISKAWHELPENYFRNLCASMPKRLAKVIDANGE